MDAKNRYAKNNYDRISVMIPKGMRDEIKKLAAAEGKSINRYAMEALEAKSGLKLTLDNVLPWMK